MKGYDGHPRGQCDRTYNPEELVLGDGDTLRQPRPAACGALMATGDYDQVTLSENPGSPPEGSAQVRRERPRSATTAQEMVEPDGYAASYSGDGLTVTTRSGTSP
jgi:hypothetical protein